MTGDNHTKTWCDLHRMAVKGWSTHMPPYIGGSRVRASFKIFIQLHLVLLKFKIHYALCQRLPYISVVWSAFSTLIQAPVSEGCLWYIASCVGVHVC